MKKYLVGADCSWVAYSTSYYIFSIEKSYKNAVDFMKDYNARVRCFLTVNQKEIDKLNAAEYNGELDKVIKAYNLVQQPNDDEKLQIFMFDESKIELEEGRNPYIEVFNGMPKCLCWYEE